MTRKTSFLLGFTVVNLTILLQIQQSKAQSISSDCISVDYNQSLVNLGVCESGLQIGINGVLSQAPTRVKETKFNKADVRNMKFRLVKEKFDSCGKNAGNCISSGSEKVLPGFRIDGDWQFQHRELLASIFGKKHYSPWVSFSGTFSQPIYFVPNDSGEIQLVSGRPKLEGSRFTKEILPYVVGFFNPGGQIQTGVQNTLNNYGITRPKEFFINTGAEALASQLGVPVEQVKSILANRLSSLSIDIANSKLLMSVSAGNEIAQLKLNNPTDTSTSCYNVDATKGWQEFPVNDTYSTIASISGSWSVDSARYNPVGAEGHIGQDAERLSPYNGLKFDQGFPFGALMFNVHNVGYFNPQQPQQLPGLVTGSFGMRINDGDNALGDNSGSLKVCLSK